ncbi:MAG: 30S ribosomal protein S6 [Alphaproteobacteria bacterium]|jgi:Ribosomal protein S6|nr:30S ribosomal protein S6 [Alphaproteobacteria bacterium]MBT4086433.1 30S ribosomal protein S6 [Alphaproteobacteria bacterium]MBT4546413.1 30S ribosomal protein S6 [Alphaproteobacteria bacterium]MBT7747692.1 30S ribosomal protein S6 [Alphaproteobacteria bacterium]
MSLYENIFLVRPDVSAAQVETLAQEFTAVIEAGGGSVPKTEQWGLRNLAYRIKKNRKAHYVLFNIDAPYEAVHEMERQMGLNEDVMRVLTIRVDELNEEPSAVMQSKTARDERRVRRDDENDKGRGDKRDDKKPAAAAPAPTAAPAAAPAETPAETPAAAAEEKGDAA